MAEWDWEKAGERMRAGLGEIRRILSDEQWHDRYELHQAKGHDLVPKSIDNLVAQLERDGYVNRSRRKKVTWVRLTGYGRVAWPLGELEKIGR